MVTAMNNTLERIVSPVRLGWHGVSVIAASTAASYSCDNKLVDAVVYMNIAAGAGFYFDSLRAFWRTRSSIRKHGRVDPRFIDRYLAYYCTRQGSRTAAANAGMTEDFDRIMDGNRKEMAYQILPHW
jgi:hypothetical protein